MMYQFRSILDREEAALVFFQNDDQFLQSSFNY